MNWLEKITGLQRMEVEGNSMAPALYPGDCVLIQKSFNFQTGDIVVFNHPLKNKKIIKRITKMKENQVFVQGDNTAESTDSRSFGWIGQEKILGKVWKKY